MREGLTSIADGDDFENIFVVAILLIEDDLFSQVAYFGQVIMIFHIIDFDD